MVANHWGFLFVPVLGEEEERIDEISTKMAGRLEIGVSRTRRVLFFSTSFVFAPFIIVLSGCRPQNHAGHGTLGPLGDDDCVWLARVTGSGIRHHVCRRRQVTGVTIKCADGAKRQTDAGAWRCLRRTEIALSSQMDPGLPGRERAIWRGTGRLGCTALRILKLS
ncbi:hypothetical protein IF1G_07268 [Cordyceps javanica]|uniref:Uncharacterized protein n=1 Tax=Cordyceps javanica TaxID=43265 RepID=A0A545UY69_9HYPO|nr:hypothetical protein IF1G_07268 [Cordyceps javanica]